MSKDKDFEELTKNIDWNRIALTVIPLLQPILIFGLWLGASKLDKRADAVAKLIAIAEPIPTIDLNVPKPVVLASLYHSTAEALDILNDVINFLKDLEVPSAEGIINETKEQISKTVEEALPDDPAFKQALAECIMNAKKNLPFGSYYILGPAWVQSCLLRKGFSIGRDWISENL